LSQHRAGREGKKKLLRLLERLLIVDKTTTFANAFDGGRRRKPITNTNIQLGFQKKSERKMGMKGKE